MKNFIKITGCLVILCGSGTGILRADGQSAPAEAKKVSEAQFDKRLPPVLPGEELSDGKNTMKVWSTTGPVPVAQPPQPWNQNSNQGTVNYGQTGSVGVIIDRRDEYARPK